MTPEYKDLVISLVPQRSPYKFKYL